MNIKEEIVNLIAREVKLSKKEINSLIEIPPNPSFGDYAFPCFKLGGHPVDEARKLIDNLKKSKVIERMDQKGPYVNFFVDKQMLAEIVLKQVFKEKNKYGRGKQKKETVVVEYPAPNTNKPLHLGHLRNISIGSSLSLILRFLGYKIHEVNLLNDRGIHICKSMLAYQKWGKNKKPNKKTDHFVGDYYVLFSKKAKQNPDLEKEAAQLLLKWEQGDKEVLDLWKKMNGWAIEGFDKTFERLGIKFEKVYAESKLYEPGKKIVFEWLKKGVLKKGPDGEIYIELEKYDLPNKILLRADGTSVYMTQDLYLAQKKYEDFGFDKSIHVVGSEQNLHFKQLFKILEIFGQRWAKGSYHLSHGLVHLPEGRLKSREGRVVDADDLMDGVVSLAEKEIKKRHKKVIKKRAEKIGLGAIKFYMLRTDTEKDMVFDPKESLSFEGETGPYIQYAHARACSILRKAKQRLDPRSNYETFNLPEEIKLVKLLGNFPGIVEKAGESYKPYLIARYLIELAQTFNEFYHKCPVISEMKHVMKARLLLVECVRQVIENGLSLLGISAPKEM